MKIAFVYGAFENLGIEYLSAILKLHGHSTRLAFDPMLFNDPFMHIHSFSKLFDYQKILLKQILDYKPDMLAFSVVSSYYQWALKIAQEIKKYLPFVHITFGGIHPSAIPEKVLANDCVDSVVIGEGDNPLLELANSLGKGKLDHSIKNIWFKCDGQIIKNPLRPYIEELDSLPFPDKELYYDVIPKYKSGYTIVTRRGCINSCSFCCNNIWHMRYPGQKKIRFRSVDNVIMELKDAVRRYNFKQLRINDDLFTYNADWLKEFSKAYKKNIGKPTCCFSSPDQINENVIRYLKDIKCYQICLGVQSVNPFLRKQVLNRGGDNKKIKEAIYLLRENKIRCVVDNILGIPGEKEEDLLETARFYNENRPNRVCIFWLIYYPRTPIVDKALKEGILNDELIDSIEDDPYRGANTLQNKIHTKNKIRFHWLLLLLHFIPAGIYNSFIKKKLYKFLPLISPSILEALYTMLAKDRLDIPRKRYYIRYFHFMRQILKIKFENLLSKQEYHTHR